MKLKDISVILMSLGIVTVLSSLFDFYTYLYPVAIKNAEWVFEVSRQTADTVLVPILGMSFFLWGLNFSTLKKNKTITGTTKIVFGSLCVLFFVFLSFNAILYGISMKPVQEGRIETLKTQNNSTKERINIVYNENKKEIPVSEYNFTMEQLSNDLAYRINYLNLSHIKINIKTLMTLFLFAFVYLIAAIKIFSLDTLFLKKRKLLK